MFPVAILAGGLATRLGPIAENIPKALLEVTGRPFIFRQLEYLRGQSIKKVVLCIGHLGEEIEAVVGDGSTFGMEVGYSPDGPVLLGTGGALKQALPLLGERFFILYGDAFLPCNFSKVQQAFVDSGQQALMAVYRNNNRWDRSNVLFRDGHLLEYNKRAPCQEMEHIDYGLGILSASVFDEEPASRAFDLAEVYHRLSIAGELAGYEVMERFYEIGTRTGLKDAEEYFSAKGKE